MSNSYNFVAHEIFEENIRDFLKRYENFKKSLFTNLEKARSNPFSGKAMHSLPPKFRQKVFRLWIGDSGDFRLIYYVNKDSFSVLGIYITLESRANFSYEKSDWLDRLQIIVDDLGNADKFAILNTEEAVKKL